MKKLLIGFLAVGLIMGFAMTASAQPNIKASGQLYVYGTYADNVSLLKNGDSRANIANRLRMQFEIQVQEGLKLTTRFDALERVWGEQPAAAAPSPAASTANMGAVATERNISWERAYVTFNALYGVFDVGYQQSRAWGTCAFCDDFDSDAGIHYRYMMGPWTFGLEYEKRADASASGEGSRQGGYTVGGTDNDHDVYHIFAIYRWATGQAGLRYELDRNATDGALAATEWVSTYHELAPYVQWVSGPFSIEAELRYIWGKQDFDGTTTDITRKGYSLYLNPKYTMGAFYGGLEFAFISGDDPTTTDKNEAGVAGGQGWDPLLMFGNYWFSKHQAILGQVRDKTGAYVNNIPATGGGGSETNLIMFKPYVGWKVNPQLEVVAQFAWLKADEKPSGYIDDDYGRELDIYATYKLYNNLSYTVGFGYFWTGDYFKGTSAATQLDDCWMVMNALNFTF
ncbi:MAG: porin [Syntrophaceae bacterium]|nr:porin [Syntrophaceae bacterium]